jgi:hypothetical protein
MRRVVRRIIRNATSSATSCCCCTCPGSGQTPSPPPTDPGTDFNGEPTDYGGSGGGGGGDECDININGFATWMWNGTAWEMLSNNCILGFEPNPPSTPGNLFESVSTCCQPL